MSQATSYVCLQFYACVCVCVCCVQGKIVHEIFDFLEIKMISSNFRDLISSMNQEADFFGVQKTSQLQLCVGA